MSKVTQVAEYRLTDHARFEMARRGITENEIDQLLSESEQMEMVRLGRAVYQSRVMMGETRRQIKVIYDSETDTLTVILVDTEIAESDEGKPGIILDYDVSGNLVSLEILDASQRVGLPNQIEHRVVQTGVNV